MASPAMPESLIKSMTSEHPGALKGMGSKDLDNRMERKKISQQHLVFPSGHPSKY